MKALWFMPLAFVAGTHGFALFAPYLLTALATVHFFRAYARNRRLAFVPVEVAARTGDVLSTLSEPQPAI